MTTLRYDIPENVFVKFKVYDILGNSVKTLVNKIMTSSSKSIRWDATDNLDQSVSTGVYLYTIEAGEYRQTKKMILLK